jgi:hypothetical protein
MSKQKQKVKKKITGITGIKDKEYAVDLLKQRVGQLEDELSNTERALDALTDRKKFVNQADKDEILDVLKYFYYDYYLYPKEKMWNEDSEIWDTNFGTLREFLEKNEVDI